MHDVTTKPPPVSPAAVAPVGFEDALPSASPTVPPSPKPFHERRLWEFRWVRDLMIVLGVVVLILLMWEVRAILTPVMLGFGFAYALNPLVTYLDRRCGIRRSMSTSGLLVMGLGAVLGLSIYVGPSLVFQTSRLIKDFPTYMNTVLRHLPVDVPGFGRPMQSSSAPLVVVLPSSTTQPTVVVTTSTTQPGTVTIGASTQPGVAASQPSITITPTVPVAAPANPGAPLVPAAPLVTSIPRETSAQETAEARADAATTTQPHAEKVQLGMADWERIGSWAMQFVGQGYNWIATGIGLVTYLIIAVTLLGCCFWYFSWKFDRIIAWFARFIPPQHNEQALRIIKRMDTTVAGFIRGRMIQASSMGLLLIIGWTLVGVPYALLLGVIGGVLHLIPYLGGAVWPLALLMAWIPTTTPGGHFDLFWIVVAPTLVYFIAQSTDSWIIEPIVQGRATHLDAITVMIAVIVGADLAGIFGMLLAIPITACGKILFQELVLPKLLPKRTSSD